MWVPPRTPGDAYIEERLRKSRKERLDKIGRSWEQREKPFYEPSVRPVEYLLLLVVLAILGLVVFFILSSVSGAPTPR